ncbi:MAG: TlpA family protein disulfide reductase [Pseudomonadota bacterium]|nr:TlpA family protein disulfide reductase [Pseudomonadota bacterium]
MHTPPLHHAGLRGAGGIGTLSFVLALVLLCSGVRAKDLDLTAYRGKVVYVDFWASWCAPCKQSFPWLDELVHEHASQDFVVIGVNVDKARDRAERFLNETRADFPIVYDPEGELATAYKVTGMPSGVLIDRTGHVRFQHAGFSEKQKGLYEQQLQTLLAEKIQ